VNKLSMQQLLTSDLPTNVLAAQARLLHVQIPRSITGGLGVSLCFLYVAVGDLSRNTIALWVAIFFASTVMRYYTYRLILPELVDDEKVTDWAQKLPVLFLFPGLIWGAMSSGLALSVSGDEVWFLIALLAGLSAGAVGALGMIHSCYLTYSLGMLAPFAVTLLFNQQWVAGLLIILFGMMNNGFAKNIYKANLDNIKTKLLNEDLLEKMELQQRVLQEQFHAVNSAMESADKANKSKSVFLAAASHDLAQPLHSLKLFLVALDNEISTDSQKLLLDRANQCADNMSDLFISLLDISNLDAGIVSVNKQLVDVAEVLEPLASEFEAQAAEKNIGFFSNLRSCVVEVDQTILQRIVRNLLHNALKYTDKGQMALEIENGLESEVNIKITDTGIGIAEKELKYIFTEFYQVGNPERDRTKGLGLGLALVERLSKLLELRYSVTSVVGRGTQFSLSLPAASKEAIEKPKVAASGQSNYLQDASILFIDDEEDTRVAMSYVLRDLGHKVLLADSLESALKAIIESDITLDLIISDYRLREGKTGVTAILRIREELNQDVPALIMTGDTAAVSLKDISDLGVDVIHKLSPQTVTTEKITSILKNNSL